jgi:hypothetical protein
MTLESIARCHCQPSGYHQLICPVLAGQRSVPPPVTTLGGTIRTRAPSRREWLPFDGSQIRLLEPEEFREESEFPFGAKPMMRC